MHYTHFTKEDRISINALKQAGLNQTQIAIQIGKNKSSICRELKRNTCSIASSKTGSVVCNVTGSYSYSVANNISKQRRRSANALRIKIPLNGELEKYVLKKLEISWSPQQIAGRLKIEKDSLGLAATTPSHQTIYTHIYLNRKEYKKYLRCKKGKYRRKYGTKVREKLREELIKKRIDTRPEIIQTRSRIGDWEGDTIVGGEKTIHILTHVERKSGYLLADKAEQATKEEIQKLTIDRFKQIPKSKIKSITYDNGVQFNKYEDTEKKLKIDIYFAYPYHSWERGVNENTNGLLREYYPKKTAFKDITEKELDKVVKLINNRPRKRLNYLTPQEVFHGHSLEQVLKFLDSKKVAVRG